MARHSDRIKNPIAALGAARLVSAGELPRRSQGRAVGGTALAGVLAALAALSFSAAVDQWPLGLILAGLALFISSIAIGYQLTHTGSSPSFIDKSLLMAAMESGDVGRVITDQDGGLVSANQAYRRLCFGRVPAPRDIGRDDSEARATLDDIATSLEATDHGRGIVRVAARGQSRTIDLSARSHGAYILWEARAADADVLLKKAVAEIDQILRPLLDGLGLGFLVRTEGGQICFMNEIAEGMLGATLSDGKDLHWSQFCDGSGTFYLPADTNAQTDAAQTCKALDFPIPGADGGQSVGWLSLIQQEGRQRANFEAPVGEAPLLSSLFEDAPMGVAIVTGDCALLQHNPTFEKLFRTAGGALTTGIQVQDWVPEDERAEFEAAVKRAVDGKLPERPLEVRFGDDRETIVQMFFSTAHMDNASYAILYAIDTTEQKVLETQFAQGQKMQAVGQLAGGIAHDFNNLLTAIIGFCDLLLLRHGPGDQSFSDLMQIKQNANRAANLVRQLLAFSRRQTLRPKVLAVTDVLAEITDLIRRLIGEKIELRMTHGRDLGPVKVDQGQLEQVIINLAVNARDAMGGAGQLTITTRQVPGSEVSELGHKMMPVDDYVLVSVSDTGHGIPEGDFDKLFEPFFTTKEVGKGTGLGLSTVYGIVKQTGGFVFARNRDGGGAVFDLYLPAHRARAMDAAGDGAVAGSGDLGADALESTAAIAPVRDLTGKETIVIAEDEDAVRLFAARALSNKGYNVLEFASGEAALEGLKNHDGKVDLLVSDVVMPGLDGPTLVEEALKDRPELKTILISGYAEGSFKQDIDESADAFLPKPFSLRELAERVKEVLEG